MYYIQLYKNSNHKIIDNSLSFNNDKSITYYKNKQKHIIIRYIITNNKMLTYTAICSKLHNVGFYSNLIVMYMYIFRLCIRISFL